MLRLATVRVPGSAAPEVAAVRGKRVWCAARRATTDNPTPHAPHTPPPCRPLGAAYPGGMAQLIGAWRGSAALQPQLSGDGLPLESVSLLAPLPAPGAILCVGKNYLDHVREMDAAPFGALTQPAVPVAPIIFTKAPGSVTGPYDPIVLPVGVSSQVDYEGELAAVIGRPGRGIARGDAMAHVFGFCVVNDVSARDLQKKHQQWYLAKSCDTFCPCGCAALRSRNACARADTSPSLRHHSPWIVPADALDARALRVRTWVNGALRQDGNTRDLIYDLETLIETISAATTLRTGDLIVTGTPAGVGAGMDPPVFLAAGDVVRIEIEGIGHIENTVVLPQRSAL